MSILTEYKPNKNEMFSKLSKGDLEDFKMLLNKYKMSYREKLNLDYNTTFGYEIECVGMEQKRLKRNLKPYIDHFGYDVDIELLDTADGCEVRTPPLKNNQADFEIVRAVLTYLKDHMYITSQCGAHIHIGSQIMDTKKQSWLNFLRLWAAYEPVIMRFSYGEYLNERETLLSYASPFFYDIDKMINKLKSIRPFRVIDVNEVCVGGQKYDCLSFYKVVSTLVEEDNTIEFRCPNGTLNPIIWQNNLNLFAKLLIYSKSEDFKKYKINKKAKENISDMWDYYCNMSPVDSDELVKLYRTIEFEEALELADLIFTTNLDKINFLKQYSKNFESIRQDKPIGYLKRAKKMTR